MPDRRRSVWERLSWFGQELSGGRSRHAPPQGMCENLVKALRLLANQQKDGDGPVKMVVQGLQVKSRLKIMDGLRRFIMVENHEAVKVVNWRRTWNRGQW